MTPQQVNFLYRLETPLDERQPQAFSQQLGKLMGKQKTLTGLDGWPDLPAAVALAMAQDGMSALTVQTMADGSQGTA